jgi:hypothetical protein
MRLVSCKNLTFALVAAAALALPAVGQAAARHRATISLYERTAAPQVLHQQGCRAAHRGVNGIVILDFGKPDWSGRYGARLFSGRFAGNHAITTGLLAYARGWARCGGRARGRHIVLARGTSNYDLRGLPSSYTAGKRWAGETIRLAHRLRHSGLAEHVSSAAADDVEPAWDRGFHRTHDFYRGYCDARPGYAIYDFGSLDGGAGGIWSARQAFYIASGMRYARAIPEIYNHAMARQWAHLAHVALRRYHRQLRFAGLITQHSGNPRAGFRPAVAHRMLRHALIARIGRQAPWVPRNLTDIRFAF